MQSAYSNLILAWVWILLGFLSGLILGLFFRREDWLGGYSSFKRRMYRLGHISFFGLGTVNLLFYLTVRDHPFGGPLPAASLAFVVGAISMPICCLIMAHFPKAHLLFSIPVVSLVFAATLTIVALVPAHEPSRFTHQRIYGLTF
jgi:hypothetical protein